MHLLFFLTTAATAGAASLSSASNVAFVCRTSYERTNVNEKYSREHSLNVGLDANENDINRINSIVPGIQHDEKDISRRSFLKSASLSFAGFVSSGPLAASLHLSQLGVSSNDAASAMGLVTFPCPAGTLMNQYHLLRAGQSLLEEKGLLSTNPLFL